MPFIIAIVGGSGSGKSTLTKAIAEHFSDCGILPLDNYYKDPGRLTLEERNHLNYDSPKTLDSSLFAQHLLLLKAGREIEMPLWDMTTHSRKNETKVVKPQKIIIVDGILSLAICEKEEFDFAIYVDADSDIRLARRLLRDVAERGRTPDSVIEQYISFVKPMHLKYVEPCRYEADFIFHNEKNDGLNPDELSLLFGRIKKALEA